MKHEIGYEQYKLSSSNDGPLLSLKTTIMIYTNNNNTKYISLVSYTKMYMLSFFWEHH